MSIAPINNKESKKVHNNHIPIVLVSLASALIALFIGYHWGYYKSQKSLISAKNSANSQIIEEENAITLYQGPVIEINGNKIVILAKVSTNGDVSEKPVNVTTNETTIFREIDVSVPSLDPDEASNEQNESREQTISLNDIQIGDNIIAEATENILGKTNFESYLITVLSTGL